MYFCKMENKPMFIQLSFGTRNSFESRFMIIVEVINEEVQNCTCSFTDLVSLLFRKI